MTDSLPAVAPAVSAEDGRALRLAQTFIDTFKESPNTQAAYRRDLTAWLQWCLERGVPPLTPRKVHVELWLTDLADEGLAASTRARRLSGVSSWYDWLLAEDQVTENPTKIKKSKKPKVNKHHSDTVGLSAAQATQLQSEADHDSTGSAAAIAILLQCALRVGELCRADIEDLTLDRGHRMLRIVGKGDKPAWIVLPPPVVDRIEKHHAVRAADVERLPALEPGAKPRRPLIVNQRGGRLNEMYMWRLIRRLARRAGGDLATLESRLKPHGLRHTAITGALDAGVPLRDVQDFARHVSPETTRRYDRSRFDPNRNAAYRLAQMFTPVPDEKES